VYPNPLSPSTVSPPLMSTCACSVAPAIPTSLTQPHINVDISYAALHVHRIVNVVLHQEYSLGIIFIFSQWRKDLLRDPGFSLTVSKQGIHTRGYRSPGLAGSPQPRHGELQRPNRTVTLVSTTLP
jgi:hypothetical protein